MPGQWTKKKKNPLTKSGYISDSFIQLFKVCFLLWIQRSRLSLELLFRTWMDAWVCVLCCEFPYGWHDLAKPSWPLVTSHSLLFKGEVDYMNGKIGSKNRMYLSSLFGIFLPAESKYSTLLPCYRFCPWEGWQHSCDWEWSLLYSSEWYS